MTPRRRELSPTPTLAELETRIGYRFAEPELLRTALTHGSASEADQRVANYERLEFLGDSVLGMTVAELLFRRSEGWREGSMSRLKASLVSTASLADCARELGIEPWVKRGRGYSTNLSHAVLADVIEAVTAAIYLDGGLQASQDFVRRMLGARIEAAREVNEVDPKTRLQEVYQGLFRQTPHYELVETSGPDHARVFVAQVRVDNREPVVGRGGSRKAAEQAAAAAAIEVWALDTVAKGDKSR